MKSTRLLLFASLAMVIVVGAFIIKRQPARQTIREVQSPPVRRETNLAVEMPILSQPRRETVPLAETPQPASPPIQTKPQPPTARSGNQQPQEPLQNPTARVALSLVGVDPYAEDYWLASIFDPTLPDNEEREDLMEDLNEEGLSDPRHPTPEDMQVIANRIPAIEGAALIALQRGDRFALEHLGEAYKDLWNLLYGIEPQ